MLGEPTSVAALGDTIKNGRRGSLTGRLVDLRQAGPRRLSPSRRQPDPRAGADSDRAADAAARSRHAGLRALQPRSRQRRRRQPRDQRHSRRGSPRLQHPLQRSVDAGVAERRNRAARRGGGGRRARTRLSFDPTNAVAFLTQRGAFTDLVASGRRGRDRAEARAVDQRRHLGRALHQGRLPGRRNRPRRRDHAWRRRARRLSTISRRFRASTNAFWSSISRLSARRN